MNLSFKIKDNNQLYNINKTFKKLLTLWSNI